MIIPKLQQSVPIVEEEGKPSFAFHRWWQAVAKQVEGQFTNILESLASVSEVAPITITADYTGVVNPSNQLPYTVAIKRFSSTTDVTTSTAWSMTATSGITATIGAATGILSITAVTASGTITVTSVYQGVTKTRLVTITRVVGAPPATGGGGGTTATDTTFNSITSTTHAAISDELTVTVGASGTVTLNTSLSVITNQASPAATLAVYGIWRWWNGAAYVDVGTEVQSSPDCTVYLDGPGHYFEDYGSLSVNTSKTGLTVASTQKFQLFARKASGSRSMSFSGTASAIP